MTNPAVRFEPRWLLLITGGLVAACEAACRGTGFLSFVLTVNLVLPRAEGLPGTNVVERGGIGQL